MAQSAQTADTETPPWEGDPALAPTPDLGVLPPAVEEGDGEGDATPPEITTFVEWLTSRAAQTDDDTVASIVDAIREMATAQSPAEVLAGGFPMHAREVVDRPMLLRGFKIREGDYEESSNLGFYAALDVVFIDTEQSRIVTCGASKVLIKLWGLDVADAFPQAVVITEKTTKQQRSVLNLMPYEA